MRRTGSLTIVVAALALASARPAAAGVDAEEAFRRAMRLRAEVAPGTRPDRFDDVLAELVTASRAAPQRNDIRLALAETLSWAGRYDEAVTVYTETVRRDDTNAAGWAGIARVRGWQGRWDEASEGYRWLIARMPHRVEGWLGLGEVAMARGNLPEARAALAKAATLAPGNADVLVHQAEVEVWAGAFRRARWLLAEALTLDPNHAKARELQLTARRRSLPWRFAGGYSLATVSGLDPWHAAHLQLEWDATPEILVTARAERLSRFGIVHWQATAGTIWEPAPRWGVFGEVSGVPDAVYLPGWSAKAGGFHGVSPDTYLSLEYAYLAYPGNGLHLLKPAVSQRLPFSTTAKVNAFLALDEEARPSGAGALDLGWRPAGAIELGVGLAAGREPTRFLSSDGEVHDLQSVVRAATRLTWTIAELHMLQIDYQHERRAGTWAIDTLGVSLGVRL